MRVFADDVGGTMANSFIVYEFTITFTPRGRLFTARARI